MCLRSDSLQKVMERLANPGIIFFTKKLIPHIKKGRGENAKKYIFFLLFTDFLHFLCRG